MSSTAGSNYFVAWPWESVGCGPGSDHPSGAESGAEFALEMDDFKDVHWLREGT